MNWSFGIAFTSLARSLFGERAEQKARHTPDGVWLRLFCFHCFCQQAAFALSTKKPFLINQKELFAQSGCRDLNPGPLAPQTSTLTGLSYIPLLKEVQK